MKRKLTVFLSVISIVLFTQFAYAVEDPSPTTRLDAIKDRMEQKKEEVEQKVQEVKDDILTAAKERFGNHIDKVLDYLANFETRLKADVYLTDAQKSAASADIAAIVSQVKDLSSQITSSEDRTSFSDLAGQVRELWQQAIDVHRKYVGLHLVGHFDNYFENLELVTNRVQIRINLLSGQGLDVSTLQRQLDSFDQSIASAKQLVTQAKAQFNSIIPGSGNSATLWNTGMAQIREAKAMVHSAVDAVREAILTIQNEYLEQ